MEERPLALSQGDNSVAIADTTVDPKTTGQATTRRDHWPKHQRYGARRLDRRRHRALAHHLGTTTENIVHDRRKGDPALIKAVDPATSEQLVELIRKFLPLEQAPQRQARIPKITAPQSNQLLGERSRIQARRPQSARQRTRRNSDHPPGPKPGARQCGEQPSVRKEPKESCAQD